MKANIANGHLCKYIFKYPSPPYLIIFNALTGGLYIFDDHRTRQLSKLENNKLDLYENDNQDFLSFCKKEYLFIEESEINIIKRRIDGSINKREQFNITVMLTEACNLRCKYCYQEKTARKLDNNHVNRLYNYIIKKSKDYDLIHIHWFGGEPLLEYQLLLDFYKKISYDLNESGKKIEHSLTTNGTLITPNIANILKKSKITHIQITIDGDAISHNKLRVDPANNGSFNSVLKALVACKNANIPLYIRINLNKLTFKRVRSLFEILSNNGIDSQSCSIYFPETIKNEFIPQELNAIFYASEEEYAQHLLQCLALSFEYGFSIPLLQPRSHFCPFDMNNTVLYGVDSYLYFCTTGTDWKIAKIDNSGNELFIPHNSYKRDILSSKKCLTCEILPICMGGCAFLEKIGKPRCTPERFILEPLIRLYATQKIIRKEVRKNGRHDSSEIGKLL